MDLRDRAEKKQYNEAKAALAKHGVVLRYNVDWEEYGVKLKSASKATEYLTSDLGEAINQGMFWAASKKENPTKMTSKQIVDQIRPGDTVTFRDRFGKARKGKAVMYGPSGWVLNIGGKYGIPLPVKESQIEKVVRSRSAASRYASRVLGKQNPAGYIDSFGRFRPIRSGTRYGNYKGKRMQWQDVTPYDDAKATGGYKSSWSAKLKAATKKAKKGKGRKKNPESRYELQRLSSGRWKYETGGDKLNSLAQEAQNVTSRYRIVDTDTGNKWSVTVLRTGSNRVSKLS